jgi:hypothetical protein
MVKWIGLQYGRLYVKSVTHVKLVPIDVSIHSVELPLLNITVTSVTCGWHLQTSHFIAINADFAEWEGNSIIDIVISAPCVSMRIRSINTIVCEISTRIIVQFVEKICTLPVMHHRICLVDMPSMPIVSED